MDDSVKFYLFFIIFIIYNFWAKFSYILKIERVVRSFVNLSTKVNLAPICILLDNIYEVFKKLFFFQIYMNRLKCTFMF